MSASAQDVTQVDRLMAAYHETGQFDSAVLVASGDEIVYERGFGQADRSWQIPITPETRFRVVGVDAQVSFSRDGGGSATALTLHQNGLDQRGAHVE